MPDPIRTFDELAALGVNAKSVSRIKGFGFSEPSPIQVESLFLLVLFPAFFFSCVWQDGGHIYEKL